MDLFAWHLHVGKGASSPGIHLHEELFKTLKRNANEEDCFSTLFPE